MFKKLEQLSRSWDSSRIAKILPWVFFVLPLLAGEAYFLRSLTRGPGRDAYSFFLLGGGWLGVGLGFFWWSLGPEPATRYSFLQNRKSLLSFVGCTCFFILNFSIWCGRKQIGGFDQSVVIDVGWRLFNGQVPYRDFVCTLPPGFYLGAFYAFKLFGVYWQSLVLLTAVCSVVTFLWSFWLLDRLLENRLFAFLAAVCAQAVANILVSYWWYNSLTSAVAVLFLLSSAVLIRTPASRSAMVSFFSAMFLLATMKPNIAGPLVMGVMLLMATVKNVRWKAFLLAGAAFLAFVAYLRLHAISLGDLLDSYRSISERALSFRVFQGVTTQDEVLYLKFMLVFLFIPLCALEGFKALVEGSRIHWLFVIGTLTGIYGILTNGEVKLVDSPLPLLSCALYSLCTPTVGTLQKNTFWIRYCGLVVILFSVVGFTEATCRTRVKAIGLRKFFDYTSAQETVPGFFKNCEYSYGFQTTKDDVETALKALAEDTRSPITNLNVYFGPRMQWAYANANLQSPRNFPIWWHPGVSFAANEETKWITRWSETQFQAVILMKNDETYLSKSFLSLMETNYPRRLPELSQLRTLKVLLPQSSLP